MLYEKQNRQLLNMVLILRIRSDSSIDFLGLVFSQKYLIAQYKILPLVIDFHSTGVKRAIWEKPFKGCIHFWKSVPHL